MTTRQPTDPNGCDLRVCRRALSGFPDREEEEGHETKDISQCGVQTVLVWLLLVAYIVQTGNFKGA